MELHCHRWPKKPPPSPSNRLRLVLLHGMGGTGALWRPIAATLENQFDILAPDQRGHGKSRLTEFPSTRNKPSYTPLDFGRDLVETLDSENFQPATIVGHSMGVRTALAFAHLRPEQTKAMILIDLGLSGPAGGGLGSSLKKFVQTMPDSYPSRAIAREEMSRACPDDSIVQYLMAVSILAEDKKHVIFPFDRGALLHTLDAVVNFSLHHWVEELGEKAIPMLFLRGGESSVWSKDDFESEKKTFSQYPSIQFEEVLGTGHGLPFEKRKDFSRRVVEFAR